MVRFYTHAAVMIFIILSMLFLSVSFTVIGILVVTIGCLETMLFSQRFYHYIGKTCHHQSSISPTVHQDLEMAKRVQDGLLSFENAAIDGIKIVKRCLSADQVVGDFFTFTTEEQKVLAKESKTPGIIEYLSKEKSYISITIGDVAGHGVSSALVMALTSGLFGEATKHILSCAKTLETVNQMLWQHLDNSHINYVTACHIKYFPEEQLLTYATAGHPPIILVSRNNDIRHLSSEGVFLGMYNAETYVEKKMTLTDGDRLIFYTDGIIEAQNKSREAYSLTRFEKTILQNNNNPIETLLERLFSDIAEFTEKKAAKDDRTLIIMEVAPD